MLEIISLTGQLVPTHELSLHMAVASIVLVVFALNDDFLIDSGSNGEFVRRKWLNVQRDLCDNDNNNELRIIQ